MLILGIVLLILFVVLALAIQEYHFTVISTFIIIFSISLVLSDALIPKYVRYIHTETRITDKFEKLYFSKPVIIKKYEKDCFKGFVTREEYTYYIIEEYNK